MSNARNLANLLGTSTTVPKAKQPAGSVLQVKHATFGSQDSTAPADGPNNFNASGLSVDITPSSTSSKILISYTIFLGHVSAYNMVSQIFRDSTAICKGTDTSNRTGVSGVLNMYSNSQDTYKVGPISQTFLDSPSTTNAITYSIKVRAYNGNTIYINRNQTNQDTDDYDSVPMSTITVMEIAG